MEFKLSGEIQLIRDTAREFADRELAPVAGQLDREERFSREIWEKIAALGFLGLLVPEEYGGSASGNLALVVALEELNRASAAVGVTVSVQNSLLCGPLVRYGSEAQKKTFLPRLATGEWIGAYALTEPGHGSDAAAIQTRAVRKGDRYILGGRKAWITSGSVADLLIVFATLDPAAGARGISAFLVEAGTPGFRAGRPEKKLGIRAAETVELTLEDVEVPVENRLGEEGAGFSMALETLDGGRIGIAAQAVGIARACLEAAVRYAGERTQFGKPIAEFQPIQSKIADMATGIEAARLLAWKAAALRDRGEPHSRYAAMAKLLASELANRAATDAVQIHGGAGYCCDLPVERYFRDAKITEIYEGTSEIQRLVIARTLLGH